MSNPELVAFLTPPASPELSREAEWVARARRSRVRVPGTPGPVPFGGVRGEGADVEVYSWGDGPSVLLVHGWGGRATHFAAFLEPLTGAGFRALAFDAPAHGRSTGGPLTTGYAFAAAARAVADAACEGRVAGVVAHSLGAVGAAYALADGLSAERVVLLAPCCWVEATVSTFAAQFEMDAAAEARLLAAFRAEFGAGAASVEKAVAGVTAPLPPLRVFHDPEDREVAIAHAEAIRDCWPGARLTEVPKVGHRSILRSRSVVEQAAAFFPGG